MLATAASGQAKHHPVYPGTRTVRGAIWDRLGGAWRLTEDALLKSERLRFIYSRNEPEIRFLRGEQGNECNMYYRVCFRDDHITYFQRW